MKNNVKRLPRQSAYKNTKLDLYNRFEASEKGGKAWTEKLNKAMQLENLQRSIELFKLSGFKKINFLLSDIVMAVYNFTNLEVSDKHAFYILSSLPIEQPDIYRIAHKGRDTLRIFTNSLGTINVQSITSAYPEAEAMCPELTSGSRLGNCHQGSIDLAIDVLKDIPSNIVTGACFIAHPKQMFLHSWVEINVDGKPKVLDYVNNAIIDKDVYYKLYNPTVYEKIPSSVIKAELSQIKQLRNADWRGLKLYLSSREEALDMLKNKQDEGSQMGLCI